MPVAPGSNKEAVFVYTLGVLWILCFWILVVRYRKVKSREVNKRVKVLLIIISAIYCLSLVITTAAKFTYVFLEQLK
jgi:glucan phosphoethanolaminetransferase (alkaline phosphatase superfamily)